MKKIFYSMIIAAFTFLSCNISGTRVNGNGKITSETRHINNAAKIKITGGIDVIINKGDPAVRIEADENLIPYIEINSEDGWLEIKERDNTNLDPSSGIKVYVTTQELNDIKVTGSGNATTNGKFTSNNNNMSFAITGSGDINADINAPSVSADIRGSGNVEVSGDTRNVDIEIKGSGNFKGLNLKAENAEVNIAGSGDANVFADAELKIKIAGSGNVKYKGKASINQSIAGSGSVSKAD